MPEGIEMTIQNKLNAEKRDLNAYHHGNKSAYMISHGSSITISLGTVEEGDYLHLSIVTRPGNLEQDCWIDIPSWCDFSVSSPGNVVLTHSSDRTLLVIPPGPPICQLKITRPASILDVKKPVHVAIGDSDTVSRH